MSRKECTVKAGVGLFGFLGSTNVFFYEKSIAWGFDSSF